MDAYERWVKAAARIPCRAQKPRAAFRSSRSTRPWMRTTSATRPPSAARRVSVHPRHLPEHVPRPPLDDAALRRLGQPGGHQRALPLPARARPDRALGRARPADPDGDGLGPPAGAGRRSARSASRSTRSPTWSAIFDGIPLDRVSTSFTINATAPILLAMYQVVGERQGVEPARLRGTVQNDILKEYLARKTYIYPPEPSLRLVADVIEYCTAHLPSSTRSPSAGTTCARRAATPSRRSRSPSRTRARTSRRSSTAASRSTTSRRASASTSPRCATSSRRSPSTGRRGASGRASCGSASAPRTPSRGCCACSPAATAPR